MFTNLASVTRCFLLAAVALILAPGAAHAADPPRPLPRSIVEYGGPGHSAEVFVHGTHGENNFVVDSAESLLLVRSLTGEPITAGTGCRWNAKWRAVGCRRPFKVNVFLHGANDRATVKEGARANFATEVWGGQGTDVLRAASGRRTSILLGGDDNDLLVGSFAQEGLWGGPGHDTIRPGGGLDHIDGGHGAFNGAGVPFVRGYVRDDGECAARTRGFWDRLHPQNDEPGGVDTLDLSGLPYGVLADLNICRLGYFTTRSGGLVHAIERVTGTPHNDRLVGDGEVNRLIGGAGEDWYSGEGGPDLIDSRDGGPDTVRCDDAADRYLMDPNDKRLGC